MKILLTGGGSGGPVTPVLAVALEIKKEKPKTHFLFVGTKKGPERAMVELAEIPFVTIPAARWRRFLSLKNLMAPFVLIAGFIKSIFIVRKFRPDVVFGAGSFVCVPVCWAAKLYGAKIVIHQQDLRVGLANRLISPIADEITTAFEQTSKDFFSGSGFPGLKLKPAAEWVGNPVRADLFNSKVNAHKYFKLHDQMPVLLVLGGATGAEQINKIINEALPNLVKNYQVVHQTGKGKNNIKFTDPNYHAFEFIAFPEYPAILKLAHVVVARSGLSTLAELSALGKAAIIIPMPGSHQEDNATMLSTLQAAAVLFKAGATAQNLIQILSKLKFNPLLSEGLSENMSKLMPENATGHLAKIIIRVGEAQK